jgi:hypothetical protein
MAGAVLAQVFVNEAQTESEVLAWSEAAAVGAGLASEPTHRRTSERSPVLAAGLLRVGVHFA